MIPYPILIVTSILLLVAARRTAARQGVELHWMGVVTVLLTVGVLMISYLPVLVVMVVQSGTGKEPSSTARRIVQFLTYLNVMANFFIYSLTSSSFRKFLKLMISSLILSFLEMTGLRQRPLQALPTSTLSTMETYRMEIILNNKLRTPTRLTLTETPVATSRSST